MEIKYENVLVNKQLLTPLETSKQPIIRYNCDSNKYYTLILNDPNAVVGNRIHWLVINIPGDSIRNGETIFNYDGPHPPEGSGFHKYIFSIFKKTNKLKYNFANGIKNRIINMKILINQLKLIENPIYTNYFKSTFYGKKRNSKYKTKRHFKNKNKNKNKKRTRKILL